MKETIRLKEVDLRRSEQEVDSLTFRNKQLELRVATLQDELEKQQGKQKKGKSSGNGTNHLIGVNHNNHDTFSASSVHNSTTTSNRLMDENVVAEEFQKKIIENAQLISLLADKSHELDACQQSLQELEEKVTSQLLKQSFLEEGLRQEIQELCLKNATLEMRLMEDDNRSVATDNSSILADTAPVSCATEDRMLSLEKELTALRAKYELLQLHNKTTAIEERQPATETEEGARGEEETQEEILFEHFSRKFDDILLEKQLAESKLISYLTECDSLREHVEILADKLRDGERQITEKDRMVVMVEDHLQTTRLNYERQISVLSEQVLSLSDQLAAASN